MCGLMKMGTVDLTLEQWQVQEQATVLVIDDEMAIRDACCQALSKDGYRAEAAENAEAGLQRARHLKPDVVMVDLKMPGMGGMELLERIRDIDANIVSIVITGYATIESAVEAMKRNAYDFIAKPFTPDQLRIVIERGLERRRLAIESARLRREKERMRENFVTLVTHQLRSPLACVKQYLVVILGEYAGEVLSKQKEMIEKASKQVDSLLRLISDWLDISHIDAGNLMKKFEPVDLTLVLSETLQLLVPLANARKVTINSNLHDDIPMVQGDRESLKQAFTNLISNGIYYNREGGTVTVSTRENEGDLVLEICDTGIGISRDNLHFIFEEFFRVKNEETRRTSGSGLGLPIAKRIIEAHDGAISVASEVGKGTTFRVALRTKR